MTRSRSPWLHVGIVAAAVLPVGAMVLSGSMQARGQVPPIPGGGLRPPRMPTPPLLQPPKFPGNPGFPGNAGRPGMPQFPRVELVWKCRLCNTVVGKVADGPKPTRCTNPNCPSNRNPGGNNNLFNQQPPPVPPGERFPPGGPPNGPPMPPLPAEPPQPPNGGQQPNAVPPVQPVVGNANGQMPQRFVPNGGHEEAGEEDGSSTVLVLAIIAGFILLITGGVIVLVKVLAPA